MLQPISIMGAVGQGGLNNYADVVTVQKRLNELMPVGWEKLDPDGKIGPITIGIILDFQLTVVELADPDGRVDPRGWTIAAMNRHGMTAKWKAGDTTSRRRIGGGNVQLRVPMVYQSNPMSCWYACVCMVAYHHVAGPRLGLPEKWRTDSGINFYDMVRLAGEEDFAEVKTPIKNFTSLELATLLDKYGPLWCAGVWDGFNHVVVLTGVVDDTVYINDPSPSQGQRVETLEWFNDKRSRYFNNVMMRYDG